MPNKTVLAIGDTHFPFTSTKSLKRVLELARTLKPQVILQLGDLYDFYSQSKFSRTLDLMTPKAEIDIGLEGACDMWRALRKAAPKAKCYQLQGNHDARPIKRLIEKSPELERFLDLSSLYDFPGVTMVGDHREELIIDGVCYQHGFRKFGDHVAHNGMSTVCGHSHQGGVVFKRLGDKTLFELNAGFIGDEYSLPFQYTMQRRFSKWTQGVGLIDSLGPRFIPFDNV